MSEPPAEKPFYLPHNWKPRPYQQPLWDYLSSGGTDAIVIAHRRWGKDAVGLNHTACSAFKRVASYCHMLPIYAQARKTLWEMVNPHTGKLRIDEAFPHEIRTYTRQDTMSIGFINGSNWQLVGSDNYDSVMGTSYAGMVESEYALGNPSAHSYFVPILMENGGWSLRITTPRGHNFAELDLKATKKAKANGDNVYWEVASCDKTGVFTQAQLDKELIRLQGLHGDQFGKSLFLQEYFASFDAAIPGSVWGDCLDKLQARGMIRPVPFLPEYPVYTAWDLGRTDATATWWFQMFGGEVRIIRYHEAALKDLPYYFDLLASLEKAGYVYGTHWLPHDARARTLAAGGKSIQQQFIDAIVQKKFGGRVAIAKRLDHMDGIQAARATFPYCQFDEEACAQGIEMLRNYHYEWDEANRVFTRMPVHDFSSHGSSAFRTLALCWREQKAKKGEDTTDLTVKLLRGSIRAQTFGEIKRHFFLRKKREAQNL